MYYPDRSDPNRTNKRMFGCVRLLVRTGPDRYQKHSFIGIHTVGTEKWNYQTVGPQSGAEPFVYSGPFQYRSRPINEHTLYVTLYLCLYKISVFQIPAIIMSKGILAEESLKNYLQNLAPAVSNGFIIGLILGQRSLQRNYIVHLAAFQSLQPKNGNDETSNSEVPIFNSIQNVNVKNFIQYAKQVAAFLPGGICILGIFTCGAGDFGVANQPQTDSNLQTFMNSFYSKLSVDQNLMGVNIPEPEKIIMHFNSSTVKITCKAVTCEEGKWYYKNIDWKYQTQPIKWQPIESRFAFDFKMPLKSTNGMTTLKSNFGELLKSQTEKIKNSQCFLQGNVHDPNTVLDTIHSGSGDEDDEELIMLAELQLPCPVDVDANVDNSKCNGDFLMNGHVYSRIFMHPKCTVADIIHALKDDIIRSLTTRFELHTDALIEEEEGSPEEKVVQHDLPRRTLITLPCSQVKLSNYLFPGETAKDSIASIQQVLGFQLDADSIEEGLEEEADPEFLLPSEDIELSCPQTPQPEPEQSFMSFYTALAVVVLFLALCTTLFLIGDEDDNIVTDKTSQ
jgi:hypothetical protein